jgi:tetratricopeptide (TPR) repeat protein
MPAPCVRYSIHLAHGLFKTLAMATLSVVFALAIVASAPTASFAQDSTATYTVEQQKLNEKGVRAIIAKDYALAIAVLEESAAIGDLNVTYLNLGRAYQKIGECESAREAYRRATSAPKVAAPSPKVVDKKLKEYTAELATECDSKQESALAEAESDLSAETQSVETQSTETQSAADTTLEPIEPAGPPAASSIWAWTTTGAGVVVMGAGVGALVWADALRGEVSAATQNEQGVITSMTRPQALENQSRAETFDAVGIGMTIGGALLTTGGVFLLLSEDSEANTSVGLRTGADRLGLVWTQQF